MKITSKAKDGSITIVLSQLEVTQFLQSSAAVKVVRNGIEEAKKLTR